MTRGFDQPHIESDARNARMRASFLTASIGTAILVALPWVYAVVIAVSSLAAPLGEFDDALPLVLGTMVQQGAVPTIDFRSFYPPLGSYVTAAMFHWFGRSVVPIRILGGCLYLLVLVLLHRLLVRRVHNARTRVALIVFLMAAILGRAITLPPWPGFALSMVALLVYLLSQERGAFTQLTLGLSGALTGVAVLYRVNFGGYVALIVAADLLIEFWPIDRKGWHTRQWKRLLLTGAVFFAPMVVFLVIFCVGVYGNRVLDGIRDFTVTSQKLMLQYRFIDLTWSFLLAGALLFPAAWMLLRLLSNTGKLSRGVLLAVGLGLGMMMLAMADGHHVSVVPVIVLCQLAGVIGFHFLVFPLARVERILLLFYVLQLHYYLSRADTFHAKFLPFAAVLLFAFLWCERTDATAWGNVLFNKGIELLGLVALIWAVSSSQTRPSVSNLRYGKDLFADWFLHRRLTDTDHVLGSKPPEAAWAAIYSDTDELSALRHLRQVTSNEDPIFVGVQDHSKLFYNNLRIYWLSGRPIGVRGFQLEDRIATEAAAQREIIHDLEQNHVNWAIIDRLRLVGDAAFARRAYSGSGLLDAFFLEKFKEESPFGRYAILRRVPDATKLRPAAGAPR